VWLEIPNADIIAVADDDPQGLKNAIERLGNPKGYADYREMLDKTKPDLISICPRWLDQHREMVLAAAESGVKGIYLEKPLCRTLREADEMIRVCEDNKVKVAVAHQTRYSPILQVVQEMIAEGKIGRVLELRGRGKEDHRGGGEDLWVLGTHVFNLIHQFGGEPEWCSATVLENDKPVEKNNVKLGKEGIGPLAGDHIRAMYGMNNGITAYFNSVRNAKGYPSRFGLMIYGSEGVIAMNTGFLPTVSWLPDSSWTPARTGKEWIPVNSAGPGQAESLKDTGHQAGNISAVLDLIAAVEDDRYPESSLLEARMAMEMIVSVFESHRLKRPVSFPLENRENPLTLL
jgi:predicted dehydrogenase